jgi:hypothetical protein
METELEDAMARTIDGDAAPETAQPIRPKKLARLERDVAATAAKAEKRRRQLIKAEGKPKREQRRRKQLAKASGRLADLRSRLATVHEPAAARPDDAPDPWNGAVAAPTPVGKPAAPTRPAAGRKVTKPAGRPAAAKATSTTSAKSTTARASKPAAGPAAKATPRATGSPRPRRRRTPGKAPSA